MLLFFVGGNYGGESYTIEKISKYVNVTLFTVSYDWDDLNAFEYLSYPVKTCTTEDFARVRGETYYENLMRTFP